jgi:hypothetical protein
VFDGGGFGAGYGVGVSVARVDVEPRPVPLLPGVTSRPTRLGELLPVAARSDTEVAAELQRIVAVEGRLAAYKVELVAGLAGRRPDSLDRQIGEPGAAAPDWLPGVENPPAEGVSEFFADELAMILNCSRTAATVLADHAAMLIDRLSATWAALADGDLDWPRARALAAELTEPAREVEPQLIAAVEAAVLPRAAELSVSRLRAAVRAELLARDPGAADRRRRQAERAADVRVRPARDGMAELSVFLPQPLAAAIFQTLDGGARMAKADGDSRPIGALRVGLLGDLALRPWDTTRPPVTGHLEVVAPLDALRTAAAGHDACAVAHHPGAHHPGAHAAGGADRGGAAQVDGQPITAAQLRDLLEQLDALCPGGLQAPAGGSMQIALTDPVSGALRATVTRAELARLARRGCPDHPAGDCACPLLDRPPPVDRYRHSPAQHRFTTTRDRTCRHPGCANRAGFADLDHVLAHAAGGETACENLCCLCRRHHRLKTHAPGWRYGMNADGTLTVTTPSGVTRTTRPPGLRDPAPPARPDEDPPPF